MCTIEIKNEQVISASPNEITGVMVFRIICHETLGEVNGCQGFVDKKLNKSVTN